MKRSILHLSLAATLTWSLVSTIRGEEIQEGTWSGTSINLNARNGNPRPQSVSLEIKKTADPHWRWRQDQRELLSATFVTRQGRHALSNVSLDSGTLSYSFQQEDATVICRLKLQQEGAYEGDCVGARLRRVTLNPPEASPEP